MRKVLIVEQEQDTRASLEQSLAKLEFEIEHVQSLAECKRRLLKGRYAAVFSNVCVCGESGLELARWFQEQRITTRFFLVTRWGGEIEPIYLKAYGIDGLVHAPVSFTEIRTKVSNHIKC
ncbi:MAG: response regulator [Chitinivibrionales bacterium]